MIASDEIVPRDAPASDTLDGFSGLRTDAARAFLLAPGIAALSGGVVFVVAAAAMPSASVGIVLIYAVALVVAFAFVGYLTALLLALPIYLLLPERARGAFAVVVPLAGAIAAAPWVALAQPWRGCGAGSVALLIPLALGCVAGAAFVLIRRGRPQICDGAAGGGGA